MSTEPMNDFIADPLEAAPLDWTLKGLPEALEGKRREHLAKAGVTLFDDRLMFPVATLSAGAIAHNRAWMRRFLNLTGVRIAPHGKTTMAPALFAMQLEDGAWGMTAATMHHVRAYRRFGVKRIVMANQIIGGAAADWILRACEADPEFSFHALVDSAENAAFLAERHAALGMKRPLSLLLEVGRAGGRTGVRTVEAAVSLARIVHDLSPRLALSGVETFEGVFQSAPDAPSQAHAMITDVAAAAAQIEAEGLFAPGPILMTAGGSAFFDLAAALLRDALPGRAVQVLIRSGCYLTHDHGIYRRLAATYSARDAGVAGLGEGLRPALHVWAHVQSRPEAGRLVCAFGKRDAGSDVDLPVPVSYVPRGEARLVPLPPGHEVLGLFDQHAMLATPDATPLRVGDLVGFGVSHPCTTFDRWRALYMIDDDLKIIDLVRTYF